MEPKYTNVLHLGIVVRDLEKAVEVYEKELGIGPWEIENANDFFKDVRVNDGYGLLIRTATCRSLDHEIELVQPVGPGFYQDWLDEHGPGMHHIILKSTNTYDESVALGERISPNSHYMDSWFPDGRPLVSYIDMRDPIGIILECGAGPGPDEDGPKPK